MRKILSFILALTMLLTSVAASAAMPADKVPAFLDKAGIVAQGTFADENALITRGQFAQLVSKLVRIDNYKGLSTTQIFNDIPLDSPLFDVTTLLYHMYFIVGDGAGNFEPDAYLTAEAACKILVNLMGDQYFAKYYGGYIPAAASKGLLSGVQFEADTNLTVKAALKLIYNTMIADISNSNLYDGNASQKNPDPVKFMSKRLGIYSIKGTVTDDGVSSLTGKSTIKPEQIKIDQYLFENQTELKDLLGYEVEGFYRYDEDNQKYNLFFAYATGKKTSVSFDEETQTEVIIDKNVLELEDYEIARYSQLEPKYEYYIDEDQMDVEDANLAQNFRTIYNGHVFDAGSAESSFTKTLPQMMNPEIGKVKLIDTNSDGLYDIADITDYEVIVVDTIDVEKYVIYGDAKYSEDPANPGFGKKIVLTNAKEDITIQNAEGTDYQFDTINKGTVLLVAKSADGTRARIGYSTTKVTGTYSANDGNDYYIGEEKYASTKAFRDYMAAHPYEIKIGGYVNFYLSSDGRVVYAVNEAEDGIRIGYLADLHRKSAIDDTLTIRVVTDGSSIADYVAAKKVILNGKPATQDKASIESDLTGFIGGLIRYKLNANDEVIYIDTPYDEDGIHYESATESSDTLHILSGANNQNAFYLKSTQSFIAMGFAVDSRTKCFVVPQTGKVEDIIATNISNSKISPSGVYKVTAYGTKDSLFAEYIIYSVAQKYSTVFDNHLATQGVVTKVREVIGDEGEPVHKITICDGDQYFEYITETADVIKCSCPSCTTNPIIVEAGDVVMYTHTDNVIYKDGIFVCYDYSQKKLVNPGSKAFATGDDSDRASLGVYHSFDKNNINSSIWYASMTEVTISLPVYVNRLEANTAELVYEFSPTDQSPTNYHGIIPASKDPVHRVVSLASTFTIRVNPKAGTFEPIRFNDLKVYNNGNGPEEHGVAIIKQGQPIMLIFYK